MGRKIRRETYQKTTDCDKNWICLIEDMAPGCEVESLVKGKCLFVKVDGDRPCSYLKPFHEARICYCPVRLELHERYEI